MFPYMYHERCQIYIPLVGITPKYYRVKTSTGDLMALVQAPYYFKVVKNTGGINIL